MKRNSEFISVKELRERWQVDKTDIIKMARQEAITCLPEYFIGREIDEVTKRLMKNDFAHRDIDEYYCLKSEIEEYEENHPRLAPPNSKNMQPDTPPFSLDSTRVVAGGYAFLKKGPSWTITYEGSELNGLRGKGFEIIHFLVSNKTKLFNINDLIKEFVKSDSINGPQTERGELDEMNQKQDVDKEYVDVDSMSDDEAINEYKSQYNFLRAELAKAQANNDLGRIKNAVEQLDKFQKQMATIINKSGKSRFFGNNIIRAKDMFRQRLKRALNTIKKDDENIWRHFYNSLRPINSFFHSYRPDRDIDWLTE